MISHSFAVCFWLLILLNGFLTDITKFRSSFCSLLGKNSKNTQNNWKCQFSRCNYWNKLRLVIYFTTLMSKCQYGCCWFLFLVLPDERFFHFIIVNSLYIYIIKCIKYSIWQKNSTSPSLKSIFHIKSLVYNEFFEGIHLHGIECQRVAFTLTIQSSCLYLRQQ